ncbi:MAG: hypothetical protein SAJ37_10680 [Oscillatoria sp. PMC 1068.18]|nr:hypothetical protein [Oscillatoria sp. PMC 1076.18]MEC4989204.1 hypothetical protein [Oscillatoria sp. PMC 1068.18]
MPKTTKAIFNKCQENYSSIPSRDVDYALMKNRRKMPLSSRISVCGSCGVELDRKQNTNITLNCWYPNIDYP